MHVTRSIYYFLVCVGCIASTIHAAVNPGSVVGTVAGAILAADDSGEPLFITPHIDAGEFSKAKNLSRVTSPPFNVRHESYAGYFTVNRTAKSHLHFWFIPRTYKDGKRAPLIVNLQESCAVLTSLVDNGPFRVDGWPQLRDNPWTDNYNMLYLDTIIGTGYSFSEEGGGFVGSHFDVGNYTYEALQQFYKLFPEFRPNDLYIAGDASAFIPAAASKIHTANKEAGTFKMPLKGIIIGNGMSGLEDTKIVYATYLHSLGIVDEHERLELEAKLKEMKSAIWSGNWTGAANLDMKLNATITGMLEGLSAYDFTHDKSQFVEYMRMHTQFVTEKEVRKCMHIGWIEYNPNASAAASALRTNFGQSVRPLVEELLQEHYRVLFYNGQLDLSSSHLMTSNFLCSLRWPGAHEYNAARKKVWYTAERKSVAGYYTSASTLASFVIRSAGHLAAADQPENVLRMIDAFTATPNWLLRE